LGLAEPQVSAGVAILNLLGTDQWNADVHGSLSVASKVSLVIKGGAHKFQLAFLLYSLNGRLKSFFSEIYDAMDNAEKTAQAAEPPKVEQVQQSVFSLRELSTSLSNTYDRAKRIRLTNNSLLAGSLSRLYTYSEDLSELADWLEMLLDPNTYESAFKRAADEKEQGQVFSLSQID
jgi:hypothetical protein